jgi:hypothetical protein
MTCNDCLYFNPLRLEDGSLSGFGWCASHPPVVIVVGTEIQSVHSQVSADRQKCHFFRSKKRK